jgi:hypothetical protein
MEIEERLTAEHRRKLKEIAEQETRGEVGQAFMEAFIRRFVIALEAAMVLGPLAACRVRVPRKAVPDARSGRKHRLTARSLEAHHHSAWIGR